MEIQELFFDATDGLELSGLLYLPKQKTEKIIISVHGMASNCMKKRDSIIAQEVEKENIAYFCFNNRGHDLISYSRKPIHGKQKTILIGTSYENVLEAYEDIKGAIQTVLKLGFTQIYLQGHSLGCTKIVYTYQRFLEQDKDLIPYIKAILLLSLIDIQGTQKQVQKNKYTQNLEHAINKEKEGKEMELMPNHAFIWPICVKTYLQYFRDNETINIARYADEEYTFPELNAIKVPLWMRWGNDNELIIQEAKQLVEFMNSKIKQTNKDIGYIDGAGHNYRGKEEELASQIRKFIHHI